MTVAPTRAGALAELVRQRTLVEAHRSPLLAQTGVFPSPATGRPSQRGEEDLRDSASGGAGGTCCSSLIAAALEGEAHAPHGAEPCDLTLVLKAGLLHAAGVGGGGGALPELAACMRIARTETAAVLRRGVS
jgi:hypothetical protein